MLTDEVPGFWSGQRLDASDSGGNAAFRNDLDRTDFAGVGNMRTSAELQREVAHAHDPHDVAVLFTKHGDGSGFLGLVERHLRGGHGIVRTNPFVHQGLDTGKLFGLELALEREVETHRVRTNLGSGLDDMLAEQLAHGSMEKVSRAV